VGLHRFGSDDIGHPWRRAIKLECTNLNSYKLAATIAAVHGSDVLADASAPPNLAACVVKRLRGVRLLGEVNCARNFTNWAVICSACVHNTPCRPLLRSTNLTLSPASGRSLQQQNAVGLAAHRMTVDLRRCVVVVPAIIILQENLIERAALLRRA
jgi:hypothetical protein